MERKRSVLITGSSSGIGLETAVVLAGNGFDVFAAVRNMDKASLLEEAAEERGTRLRVVELDVCRPGTVRKAVEEVIEEAGGIYGLVNNAGIAIHGYFEDLSGAEVCSVFDTNVFGTMDVTRAVLPSMRKSGEGRIIIVGSVGGRIAGPAASAYCASKFALEGFGEALHQEVLPFGISVVLVEPGMIKTKIWSEDQGRGKEEESSGSAYQELFENQKKLVEQQLESARVTTTDVARAVCKSLQSPRPRLRYVVGKRARLVLLLRRYVPGEVFDRAYFRAIERRISGH